ncbi:MAG: hypothetical protein M1835_000460 [Candelina submexicana]|nr:MAG: hypothetical protein M1835_000460 [Candelina submexicana]
MAPLVTKRPYRLFEIDDQEFTPANIRFLVQELLTAFWTARVPLIQRTSPASLAASVILHTLSTYPSDSSEPEIMIVDFASGAGGPTPTIERIVNTERRKRGQKEIVFTLSDIKPHIEAWRRASKQSMFLDHISRSVDATNPPQEVTSGRYGERKRVFRLYCLAFHHFDDDMAKKVLESTLETSDGFAYVPFLCLTATVDNITNVTRIVELVSRQVSSFILMLLYIPTIFVVTIFWYPFSLEMLFYTYVIPIVPFIVVFDGFISALRTRTFGEVLTLVDRSWAVTRSERTNVAYAKEGWTFEAGEQLHSWPVGYMNWIVGTKGARRGDRH